jgi:hypothetical protein
MNQINAMTKRETTVATERVSAAMEPPGRIRGAGEVSSGARVGSTAAVLLVEEDVGNTDEESVGGDAVTVDSVIEGAAPDEVAEGKKPDGSDPIGGKPGGLLDSEMRTLVLDTMMKPPPGASDADADAPPDTLLSVVVVVVVVVC